ncbi:hypothetical protein SAMN05444280_1461 [Tangfeifania diversioriginum]|uniref:Uncharacterized protein n=1 Tax=Tangfeifania diversioriginum TaxID=1168035 RepID=A0A1M6NST6_9BACT|nr:hypothetical protein SAMN05444280_1461 [Tangfeifania diversioriginum]
MPIKNKSLVFQQTLLNNTNKNTIPINFDIFFISYCFLRISINI